MTAVLALEFAGDRLHAVRLEGGAGGATVGKSFTAPLPTTLTPAHGAELGAWLKRELAANNVAPADVVICLGRGHGSIRQLEVPDVPIGELPDLVRMTLEADGGEDPGVVDFDSSTPKNGQRRITAVSVSRKVATAVEEMCKTAGLQCKRMVVRPYALRFLRDKSVGEPSAAGAHVLMAPSPDGFDLSIWDGGRLEIARTILPNGAAPEANAQRLAAELKRTLAAFHSKSGDKEIDSAAVLTGDAAPYGESVETTLAKPLALVDPAQKVKSLMQAASAWGAVGAGWQYLAGQSPGIDLYNPRKAPPPKYSAQRIGVLAGAFAVLVAVSVTYWRSATLAKLDKDIAAVSEEVGTIDKTIAANKPVELRHDDIAKWKAQAVDWLDALNELAYRLPDTDKAYLQSLTADTNQRESKATFKAVLRTRGADAGLRNVHASNSFDVEPKGGKTNEDFVDFKREESFEVHFAPQFRKSKSKGAVAAPPEVRTLAAVPSGKRRENTGLGTKKSETTSRPAPRAFANRGVGGGAGGPVAAGAPPSLGGEKSPEAALAEKIAKMKEMPQDQFEAELMKEKSIFRNRIRKMVDEARGKK